MDDVLAQVNAVHRQVGKRVAGAGEATVLTISRTYGAEVEDVWDACTDPERIGRWLLPISGDLRLGGRYQLEGNAGGTIERCDPPKGFAATWEFGGGISWVEVRLSASPDGGTRFELEHSAVPDEHWGRFGSGAAGIGWDLSLLGLGAHLAGQQLPSEEELATDERGKQFIVLSGQRWGEADIEAGVDPVEARARAERTIAFFSGTGEQG